MLYSDRWYDKIIISQMYEGIRNMNLTRNYVIEQSSVHIVVVVPTVRCSVFAQ